MKVTRRGKPFVKVSNGSENAISLHRLVSVLII